MPKGKSHRAKKGAVCPRCVARMRVGDKLCVRMLRGAVPCGGMVK